MKQTEEVFLNAGLAHEIVDWSESTPMRVELRCGFRAPPQFGGANIGPAGTAVTCLSCLGHIEPEKMEADVDDNDGDGWGSGGGGGLGG